MFKNINIPLTLIICLIIFYITFNVFIVENFVVKSGKKMGKSKLKKKIINKKSVVKIETPKPSEIWGINDANEIWKAQLPCSDDNKCSWIPLGDSLKQVSQGNNEIWGIDIDGNIKYCPNTINSPCKDSEDWKDVSGNLEKISVGTNDIWGIDANGNVKYCNNKTSQCKNGLNRWSKIQGTLKQISVGKDDIWGIDIDNKIKYCNNKTSQCKKGVNTWSEILSPMSQDKKRVIFNQISVGENDVWGVLTNGDIYKCNKECKAKNCFKRCKNDSWQRVQGKLEQISVGNDAVWGVTPDKKIQYCINNKNYPCSAKEPVWKTIDDHNLSNISIN